MDAERKLITIQVKYETLEKTHTTTRHLLKKMKVNSRSLDPFSRSAVHRRLGTERTTSAGEWIYLDRQIIQYLGRY